MSIVVSRDKRGYVNLRHSRWAAAEPTRGVFTMTAEEWDDLLWRAACYELERRRLPSAAAAGRCPVGPLVLNSPDPGIRSGLNRPSRSGRVPALRGAAP